MKSKTKNVVMALTLAALLLVGGVFAYLTDTDNQTNTFTMGNVEIDLTEPTWDNYPDENNNDVPDIAEDIWAGKVIAKDPTITNTGDNSAYVYLMVSVPKQVVLTAQADGTPNPTPGAPIQLFNYTVDNEHWELLKSNTSGADENVYLYAYKTALVPRATTATALFDEIEFVNVIEGQIASDVTFNIPVVAYAIQANFGAGEAGDALTAAQAWELYANQNSITIFD